MSDRHGVAFVGAGKVSSAIGNFAKHQSKCDKVSKAAIDRIIRSYEPNWWQELVGSWDRMSRPAKVRYLKNYKYEYWKWFDKISQVSGVLATPLTFDEVEAFMYGTDVRLWKELKELYDASETGELEVGHEYATFINKWSEDAA